MGAQHQPRRGRVLVVDDEPLLATAIRRSLELDFDVEVITSGRDALERLRTDGTFDAILCDLLMPVVCGMDLHAELARTRPEVAERMIFMTGGTVSARARDFLAAVPNPTLDKPFDIAELTALLRARTTAG